MFNSAKASKTLIFMLVKWLYLNKFCKVGIALNFSDPIIYKIFGEDDAVLVAIFATLDDHDREALIVQLNQLVKALFCGESRRISLNLYPIAHNLISKKLQPLREKAHNS